jgi:biopolymer transport protein ExbD
MAGAMTTGGGGRGSKAVDCDINMVPMIDLLMVTIAFLLITAVWTRMSRLEGSAQVPGPVDDGGKPPTHERALHVDMRAPDRFVLSWREGQTVARSVDVPREYPALAQAISTEWRSSGSHTSPTDALRDQAVLHTGDDTPFREMVAVMDAIEATKRAGRPGGPSAFALTLSTE